MKTKSLCCTSISIIFLTCVAYAQAPPKRLDVAGAPIPIHVLVQSPAETTTQLQVICLFESKPDNALHGSLTELNEKLGGILDKIRKPESFAGSLGETLLLSSASKQLFAKQLLIIGLGDSKSYTPQRMELVGAIVYREAARLGVAHPFFAPTVLDGGVTGFSTGETASWFVRGFFRAAETEKTLASAGLAESSAITEFTFLAGPTHAEDTQQAIAKLYAVAK